MIDFQEASRLALFRRRKCQTLDRNPKNEALFYLNPTGAVLRRLLEEGTSGEEAVEVIFQAFPGANATSVKVDIVELISEFFEH